MIKLRGVSKRLGGKNVLDQLDLDIQKGETLVVLGPSGTGKSVLLKHIIGLMAPDRGTIEIDGQNIVGMKEHDLDEVRKKFGMLFQGAALFDSMTVGENIGLGLREHTRMKSEDIEKRVLERLEWVGLKAVENAKPASLSGGMKKRAGLARAIAMDPEFILYDEPTTGLDPIMSDVINTLIRDLQKRMGVTSIVVTHDMTSATKVADRMAMLYGGKVVFEGTPAEVHATKDPLMRQFIEGSSAGPIKPV